MDNITIENLKMNFYKFIASSLMIQKIFDNFPSILEEMSSESYYKILSGAVGKLSTFNNFWKSFRTNFASSNVSMGKISSIWFVRKTILNISTQFLKELMRMI